MVISVMKHASVFRMWCAVGWLLADIIKSIIVRNTYMVYGLPVVSVHECVCVCAYAYITHQLYDGAESTHVLILSLLLWEYECSPPVICSTDT